MIDYKLFNISLLGLVICVALLSLMIGSVYITPYDIMNALLSGTDNNITLIFLELRLPRTLLALSVGAALGLSGAVLQGWLRNPLADPSVLGTTSCAALGGVIAIHTGLYAMNIIMLPLGGIIGALFGTILIAFLTLSHVSTLTIILAGIALQSLSAAMTALALNLAPDPHTALEIMFWLMGSVSERSFDDVILLLPFFVIGCILSFKFRKDLDALTLGEDTAISMGVNLKTLKYSIFLSIALMVGAVTAIAGSVGFVGLAIPHILRPFLGEQPSKLLLPSLLGGALLVLVADIIVRIIPTSSELKLGVVTSLIGIPFFFKILLNGRRRYL